MQANNSPLSILDTKINQARTEHEESTKEMATLIAELDIINKKIETTKAQVEDRDILLKKLVDSKERILLAVKALDELGEYSDTAIEIHYTSKGIVTSAPTEMPAGTPTEMPTEMSTDIPALIATLKKEKEKNPWFNDLTFCIQGYRFNSRDGIKGGEEEDYSLRFDFLSPASKSFQFKFVKNYGFSLYGTNKYDTLSTICSSYASPRRFDEEELATLHLTKQEAEQCLEVVEKALQVYSKDVSFNLAEEEAKAIAATKARADADAEAQAKVLAKAVEEAKAKAAAKPESGARIVLRETASDQIANAILPSDLPIEPPVLPTIETPDTEEVVQVNVEVLPPENEDDFFEDEVDEDEDEYDPNNDDPDNDGFLREEVPFMDDVFSLSGEPSGENWGGVISNETQTIRFEWRLTKESDKWLLAMNDGYFTELVEASSKHFKDEWLPYVNLLESILQEIGDSGAASLQGVKIDTSTASGVISSDDKKTDEFQSVKIEKDGFFLEIKSKTGKIFKGEFYNTKKIIHFDWSITASKSPASVSLNNKHNPSKNIISTTNKKFKQEWLEPLNKIEEMFAEYLPGFQLKRPASNA